MLEAWGGGGGGGLCTSSFLFVTHNHWIKYFFRECSTCIYSINEEMTFKGHKLCLSVFFPAKFCALCVMSVSVTGVLNKGQYCWLY